jgi:thioredoxin reductase (NADPH)
MVLAEDLIKNLLVQIEPFKPSFTLGERVEKFVKNEDGSFLLTTSSGTEVACKVVAIAGGLGCFEPRKPEIPQLEQYEGKGVTYMILNPENYRNKRVVLAGGGDSALDWAIYLADVAAELTLIHRNESFRGAPDSVEKVMELARENKIRLLLKANVNSISGNGKLTGVSVTDQNKLVQTIPTDYFIPLFGLSPKLGPLENWGLNLDKSAIAVDTFDYSTTIPGVYAIGDINTYPGKLKLILCGFHESALMAQSAYKVVYPNQKFSLKYTTVNGIQSF